MNKRTRVGFSVALALGLAWTFPLDADACTTFASGDKNSAFVGKSYDWDLKQGMVLINKRGIDKKALAFEGTPVVWRSTFASLTFNQYGRELPNGGMNEAGLVVEIMWLDSSEYPQADKRDTVNELQWIQYQLDNSASVSESIALAKKLRVTPVSAKVHYMVCDAAGSCGAFEYIDGALKVSSGRDLPPVLTNDTYEDSLAHLKQYAGFGGTRAPLVRGKTSLDRFVVASLGAKSLASEKDPTKAAFELLRRVRNGTYSKWNIVYDIEKRTAYFKTQGHGAIKEVSLGAFDGSCRTPTQMLELNADVAGDVAKRFVPYTQQANHKLISKTLEGVAGLPPGGARLVAAFPETYVCSLR